MEVFEAYKGMYDYQLLPSYAQFLLNHHLADFAKEQIAQSRKVRLPLMIGLSTRLTEEQITSITIESSREYLTYLANNQAHEQIRASMSKWLEDQLDIVAQHEISAQDITLIYFIRGQALKKFIPYYTKDIDQAVSINAEIDLLLIGATTTSANIYLDILEGKIAEQSNFASKLIEATPAITFLFDPVNNKQIFVSGKVAEVMGYTSEELIQMGGNFFLQRAHPRDIELLIDHMQNLISENSRQTGEVEYRFKHKDGRYRWLRTYEVIFSRDSNGKPSMLLGKTFEITREKETAISLQQRERQLLEAQTIAHIGSYEWNFKHGRSINTDEVYRIFDTQGHQEYNEFMSYVHPDDVQKVKDALAESFITGKYECEYRYVKNNREKVIWSIGKVEFRDDEPYRMIGTVQDVTEIKRMERDLMQKSNELAESNESLRQFAFVASHDMKEPLRKIMMFSDLVLSTEKDNLSAKSVFHLQKMQVASKNLYKMIEDILSFSLLQAKEQKNRVSLDSIINQVTEVLEESIKEKNAIILHKDLPEAFIIESQFKQLFQNLVANSLKFAKKDEQPEIIINARLTSKPAVNPPGKADQYLEISVQDNGIGFPKEVNEKIFELFSRLHSKSEYEGTGLGLSISRRIVENHDGVIVASSNGDSGATFTIVIPQ